MKQFRLRKRAGAFRTIWCPDSMEKRALRALVPQLNLIAEELDIYKVCHGFTESRSPVTNAREHIGYAYTVTMDLSDFFDSVTEAHVRKALALLPAASQAKVPLIGECFVEGAARQGLPTSPALANIAAAPMHREIVETFCQRGRFVEPPVKFTAYADDLTMSTNNPGTVDLLLQEIPKLVERHGFRLNASKTKVQAAVAGRRMITGVACGEKDIAIPREVRRRIRAGEHQQTHGMRPRAVRRLLEGRKRWRRRLPLSARLVCSLWGLQEWSQLKLPKEYQRHKENPLKAGVRKVAQAASNTSVAVVRTWNRLFHRKFG